LIPNKSLSLPIKPMLMALSVFGLLMGLWGGLVRLGWLLPLPHSNLVSQHGALMLSGFLGALISLERAVAVERRWAYAAPALAGLGGLTLSLGLPNLMSRSLIVAGSLGLVAIFIFIVQHRPDVAHAIMGAGALLWLVGNVLWLLLAPQFNAGFAYDAMLHIALIGFVFSMIFGHAPVIAPGVLRLPFVYSPLLYGPLALLHLALMMRLMGDALHNAIWRMWGGLFNEIAIVGFLLLAVWVMARELTHEQRVT
jgi:hypothetical protein